MARSAEDEGILLAISIVGIFGLTIAAPFVLSHCWQLIAVPQGLPAIGPYGMFWLRFLFLPNWSILRRQHAAEFHAGQPEATLKGIFWFKEMLRSCMSLALALAWTHLLVYLGQVPVAP
jgi:hypothetical protein